MGRKEGCLVHCQVLSFCCVWADQCRLIFVSRVWIVRDANEVICDQLRRLAPHIPIVSEENRAVPYDIRRGYRYFWCVDPLDGTKEFIKRNGQFTVNIALVRADTPILGVVHTPCESCHPLGRQRQRSICALWRR